MKAIKIIVSALAIVALTGCSTRSVNSDNALAAYAMFQSQPHEVRNVSLKGTNMTITITGASELIVASAAAPRHALPTNPTTGEVLIKELAGLGKFGFGAWAVGKGFDKAGRGPTVVNQPEPIIVQPSYAPAL